MSPTKADAMGADVAPADAHADDAPASLSPHVAALLDAVAETTHTLRVLAMMLGTELERERRGALEPRAGEAAGLGPRAPRSPQMPPTFDDDEATF